MQRARKETVLPVTTVTDVGKSAHAKVFKQEDLVVSARNPVTSADKNTGKSTTDTSARLSMVPPKTNKTAALNNPVKQKTEDPAKPVSAKRTTLKTIQSRSETAETKVGIVIPKISKNPIRKKIKPIGPAVFRGKHGRYDFEVFSLDAELKDGSAIYIISRRVTDKSGKGHHKFVCLGQAESILDELKSHARGKCIKHYKANVICLLREKNENIRIKIEIDLREAHTIVCNHKNSSTGNLAVTRQIGT